VRRKMDYRKLVKGEKGKNIKVTLKKGEKGVGLYATKDIEKGEVIAYYKIKIFLLRDYNSPTDYVYSFEVYRKNGEKYKKLIGDIYEGSFPTSENGITFWAPFANEPSLTKNEKSNSEMDINLKYNYSEKTFSSPNEIAIYKLLAKKKIRSGEEILWYYGDEYSRNYSVSKK
jgi:hypothetical protein